MISAGLSSWQTANGFRLENDVVYGVYKGIGFAVACEDGGKLFTFMLVGEDAAFDSIEDTLVKQSSRLRNAQVGDVDNYLALFFEENGLEMPDQLMTSLLDFVADNARGAGFSAPRVCVKCGAPANKRSFYNNMVQPMCPDCSEAERQKKRAAKVAQKNTPSPAPEPKQDTRPADSLLPTHSRYNPDEDDTYEQYDRGNSAPLTPQVPPPPRASAPSTIPLTFSDDTVDDGSLAKGILGAVLGAIAGLIPLTVFVLLGIKLTVLCIVAGLGSVLGYIIFDGLRRKTSSLITTFTVSEILSVLAFLFLSVIRAMSEDGKSFGEAFKTSIFVQPADYINFIIAVICAALGIFVLLDKLADYIAYGKNKNHN